MASILVADDDPSIRDAIRYALVRDGHEVAVAANGAEALKQARKTRFDVIFTDIYMPEMDGLQLLLSVKDQAPRPAIVATTGASLGFGWSPLAIASALGADAVLAKPFDFEELRALIAKLQAKTGRSAGEDPAPIQ
ncbi:MAG: response regulator [Alphaproteobacteria bacterium]|nr:response regulator [Alphaproteobacteria bacterium]